MSDKYSPVGRTFSLGDDDGSGVASADYSPTSGVGEFGSSGNQDASTSMPLMATDDALAAFEGDDGPEPLTSGEALAAIGKPTLNRLVSNGEIQRKQIDRQTAMYWPAGGLRARVMDLFERSNGPEPRTQREIQRELDSGRGATSRALDALVASGMIETKNVRNETVYW